MTPAPKPKIDKERPPRPQGLTKKAKAVQPAKKKKKPRQRSIMSLKKEAWRLMSIKIRKQYSKNGICTCYTCGSTYFWQGIQAGHGIAGRGNAILFDERIIRPQCYSCNCCRSGKYQVFVPKLIRELGQEVYEQIERESHLPVKRDRGYYLELIEKLSNELENL